MASSLADDFARALGLNLSERDREAKILGPSTRHEAAAQITRHIGRYQDIRSRSSSDAIVVMADFASRFLPALIETLTESSIGSVHDDLLNGARFLVNECGKTPSMGRLLRDRPDTFRDLFVHHLADLLQDNGQWDSHLLFAPSGEGEVARRRFDMLVVFLARLLVVLAANNHPSAVLQTSQGNLSALVRLHDRLASHRLPSGTDANRQQLFYKRVDDLSCIISDLSGTATLLYECPFRVNYWSVCEASERADLGPCTSLAAQEEMSCCGGCVGVRYCSRAHQKAHWKTHKPLCFKPTW